MEREDQPTPGQDSDSEDDMPHGGKGSDRPGGQVGVGTGGLGGEEPGGTQSDQGRGYGAEGGSARQEFSGEQDMPHAGKGSDRPGAQVGVGTGGLGGQEWSDRREESSGEGDEESDDAGSSHEK